jgi:glycerophosphoryl diester phosphodiesterase
MSTAIKLILTSLFSMIFLQNLNAQSSNVDLQGHRGSRGLMPENTIEAMLEAIKWGVTTLEMDVVITKDKQVVLSHEPFMNLEIATPPIGVNNNVNAKAFNIFQMTYEEVKTWDVGSKFNPRFSDQKKMKVHKPLLKELIEAIESYTKVNNLPQVAYNIETKMSPDTDELFHPGPVEFVDLLSKVVIDAGIANRTTIQSFDPRSLIELHKRKAPFQLSYLIEATQKITAAQVITNLGFKPDVISPDYSLVDASFVHDFHQQKMKIIVWTVNQEVDIKKMAALGVDGIISDYPNRFAVLKQY